MAKNTCKKNNPPRPVAECYIRHGKIVSAPKAQGGESREFQSISAAKRHCGELMNNGATIRKL